MTTISNSPSARTWRPPPTAVVLRLLAVAVAACLAVDAWFHLRDAADGGDALGHQRLGIIVDHPHGQRVLMEE